MNFVNNDELYKDDELVKENSTNEIIFEIKEQLKDILERLTTIEMVLHIGDYE